MKFNCGPTRLEKRRARHKYLTSWHPFFAIWPRRVGKDDCRMLEIIYRIGRYETSYTSDDTPWWTWEYVSKETYESWSTSNEI